jgi:hypothetical protein
MLRFGPIFLVHENELPSAGTTHVRLRRNEFQYDLGTWLLKGYPYRAYLHLCNLDL